MTTAKRALALAVLSCAPSSALAATITNPSFEENVFTTWPGYVSGLTNGPINGWTPSGIGNTTDANARTGINSNPPTWVPANTSPFGNNGAYPDGTQVGFIQAVSAVGNPATTTLSNTITDLIPGETYRLNFRFNSRFNQRPNANVTVGGRP